MEFIFNNPSIKFLHKYSSCSRIESMPSVLIKLIPSKSPAIPGPFKVPLSNLSGKKSG